MRLYFVWWRYCQHLFKSFGFEIGESIASSNRSVLEKVKSLMLQYKEKFILPLDAVVGNTYDRNYIKYKINSRYLMLMRLYMI